MKIFLSYSTKDKVLAGQIKQGLESFGVECFLAHEDITPSRKWTTILYDELHHADVFIPILTQNFLTSQWANQEVGIAYSTKKLIIPLKKDVDPEGFIYEIQALQLGFTKDVGKHPDSLIKIDETTFEVIKIIVEHSTDFQNKIKPLIITKFSKCENKVDTERLVKIIDLFTGLHPYEVSAIISIILKNEQIGQTQFVKGPFLKRFIKEYEEYIDPLELKKLKKLQSQKTEKAKISLDELWNRKWKDVQRFIKKYGYYPQKEGAIQGEDRLGNWVREQREVKRKGKLRPDRLEILEKEGFDWNPSKDVGRRVGSKDRVIRKTDGYYGSQNARKKKDINDSE